MTTTLRLFFLFLALSSFRSVALAAQGVANLSSTEEGVAYFFPPEFNGLSSDVTDFIYKLNDDGTALEIGPVIYDSESLIAALFPLSDNEYLFLLKWPEYLIKRGQLVRLNADGEATWTQPVTDSQIEAWRPLRQSISASPEELKGIDKAGYGFKISLAELDKHFPPGESFVFCFLDPSTQGEHHACSAPLQRTGTSPFQFERVKLGLDASVKLNEQPAPARSIISYESEKGPIQFEAQLKSGATYAFKSEPEDLKLVDILHNKEQKQIKLTGYGVEPFGMTEPSSFNLGASALMNREFYPQPPKLWELSFPDTASFVYIPGKRGGYFRYPVFVDSYPQKKHRIYSTGDRVETTYSSATQVEILNPNDHELKMPLGEKVLDSQAEATSVSQWSLKSAEMNTINSYKVSVIDGQNTYTANLPVYRGFPYELSGMLGGAAEESSLALAGEMRLNAWFEAPFGCRNWLMCYQRWGTRLRYTQSRAVIDQGFEQPEELVIASMQFDLYYRLLPGVWGVEEVLGLVAGYQDLHYNELGSRRLGVGFIWGRALPQIFEKFFDYLPYMDYPKWVHMDFTYFPKSLDSNVTFEGNPNWTLNFQGRVNWSERIYGETGFGMYSVDYISNKELFQTQSTGFFGTMGLGVRF